MQKRSLSGLISQAVRLIVFPSRHSAARIAALIVGVAIYIWQTYPQASTLHIADALQTKSQAQAVSVKKAVHSEPVFVSPAGVRYGADPSGRFDSRVEHVMAHTREDNSKMRHSVFVVKSKEEVIALIDEAWKKRGPPHKQGKKRVRDVYDVDMGRVIGTQGERVLRMIMESDGADIVTAYPRKGDQKNGD